jgi:hypothetical protein
MRLSWGALGAVRGSAGSDEAILVGVGAPEVKAAEGLGFEVCTIAHDALSAGDFDDAVRRAVGPTYDAVYRGWMVRSEHYVLLATALVSKGLPRRSRTTDHWASIPCDLPRSSKRARRDSNSQPSDP